MKKNTRVLLTVAAMLLLCAAAVCTVLLILDITDSNETPEPEQPRETLHEEEERRYNEDGTLSKIVYYKNDVLQGSTDYVYMNDAVYIVYFDGENQKTGYEKTVHNAAGSPISYQKQEGDTLVESAEYDYYDDLLTMKKKTVKLYEDGVEHAQKEYYNEAGFLTRKCTYTDGKLDEDISYTYNEAGGLISAVPTDSEVTENE